MIYCVMFDGGSSFIPFPENLGSGGTSALEIYAILSCD